MGGRVFIVLSRRRGLLIGSAMPWGSLRAALLFGNIADLAPGAPFLNPRWAARVYSSVWKEPPSGVRLLP